VYDSTGTLIQKRIYKDGIFSENIETQSNPEKTTSFFTGTGYHTVYRLDMQIDKKGYFEEGILIKGEAYIYKENGKLTQIKTYEKGKITKINNIAE
jgi:antitoxin component YwqK of YwqJK toxin-antitoxin module